MMNVIINEELKRVAEEVRTRVRGTKRGCKEYTPEKTSEITWVPKEKIIEAARMFAIDTPGCIQVGSSLERQANCGHTVRAITCLMGLTGNIERPGSMISWVLPETGLIEDFFLEMPITEEMRSKIIGIDKFKMGAARTCNPDTMIKAISVRQGTHPGLDQRRRTADRSHGQYPGSRHGHRERWTSWSMSTCSWGRWRKRPTWFCPAAHWLELDDVYDMHPRFMIEAHNKVIEPPGEAKSDAWIFNEIGKRVAPEYWFKTWSNCLDYQVRKGSGGNMTWKQFSQNLVSGCWGKDQVYYKYKTDYWRKGGGFPTPPASSSSFPSAWKSWVMTSARLQ